MTQLIDSSKVENTNAVLMNYKDEERQLSESLFRNLHVMQRFHEPTGEFLNVFEPHMFIKSNPKAFAPVMHFIFNCLDAAEFNKRFLWPIFDKSSETRFRKTALDYMNHLNVTHQLGLETLKLSNIHIPGGLKFIKIIHKFTYLIMKEEMKKRECKPFPTEIPDADAQLILLEEFVEQGLAFATTIQGKSDILIKRIDEMKAMMESCFEGSITNEAGKERCWSCLADEWSNELDSVMEKDVILPLERINVVSKQSAELNELLTKLFVDRKENVVQYAKADWAIAQRVLKKMNPDLEQAIDGIFDGNFINFENLLQVFSFILPTITKKIETFEFRGLEAIQFESDEIMALNTKAEKLAAEMNDLKNQLVPFIKKDETRFREFCTNNPVLPYSIMQTPPFTRRCQFNKMRNRLALLDDTIGQPKLFKEPLMKRTTIKHSNLTKSSRFGSDLFNTSKSQNAAFQIISKSKQRVNSNQTLSNMSTLGKFSTPKFSSTMCSTVTNTKKNSKAELKFSPMFPMTPTHVFSENVSETTSVVSPNGVSIVRTVSKNSTYCFNQPNDPSTITSPTRRYHLLDVPRHCIAATQANENQLKLQDKNQGEDNKNMEEKTVIDGFNSARSAFNDFIGNVSDTLLNDVSLTD